MLIETHGYERNHGEHTVFNGDIEAGFAGKCIRQSHATGLNETFLNFKPVGLSLGSPARYELKVRLGVSDLFCLQKQLRWQLRERARASRNRIELLLDREQIDVDAVLTEVCRLHESVEGDLVS